MPGNDNNVNVNDVKLLNLTTFVEDSRDFHVASLALLLFHLSIVIVDFISSCTFITLASHKNSYTRSMTAFKP